MIKDRPAHLLRLADYCGIPALPIAVDFTQLPDLILTSIAQLGGVQPVTGAMAAAARGELRDKPSAAEVALHRERGTRFQLIFVVVSPANLAVIDGVAHGTPYALSLIPASKRDAVEIVDIDTVSTLDVQKLLTEYEPSYLGYDPFASDWSLYGSLASFLERGLKNTFPDELGLVVGQYFLALQYDPADMLTVPAGFSSDRAESKYNAHRARLLFTPFKDLRPRRVCGADSPIELFLLQELLRRGVTPQLQMLLFQDGTALPSLYHLWREVEFRYVPDLVSEVDFYFPEKRLAVFCDSARHHSRAKDKAKDVRIDARLAAASIRSLRVPGPLILRDLAAAADIISSAVSTGQN